MRFITFMLVYLLFAGAGYLVVYLGGVWSLILAMAAGMAAYIDSFIPKNEWWTFKEAIEKLRRTE